LGFGGFWCFCVDFGLFDVRTIEVLR
jgi:hypothetical protein